MKLFAFIKKDLYITISYRFKIVLQFGSMVIYLCMFYFIGEIFSGAVSPYLENYGGNYFSYALVGLSVSSFVIVGLDSLSDEIRSAQLEGTLEALLSTPTSIYIILIGNSLWSFFEALLGTIILLTFGVIFFGLKVSAVQIFAVLLVLSLTLLAFLSIGMLSASFIMIFKQGNPIEMIFGTLSYFLGGIVFPVEVLPLPFQYLAELLPITHAVKALRELLLAQMEFQAIIPLLINLVIFILLLSPVSILFFRYAVKRAKIDGSLIQY